MKLSKKSQMEILGLALVIVLLIIGGVLAVKFLINETPNNSRRDYVESELTAGMITALLHTNSECKNLMLSDIIAKCVEAGSNNDNIGCGVPEKNACSYANSVISSIFTSTLKVWNTKYEFLVYRKKGTNIIKFNEGNCVNSNSKNIKISTSYLPTNAGTATIELYVCN